MANITIRVDDETAREAKLLAARRGTSLDRLVADQLKADRRFDKARTRALKRLRDGYDLEWQPFRERGEIYRSSTRGT